MEIEFVENRANGHLHPAAVSFTGAQEESGEGVHLWHSLDSPLSSGLSTRLS